MKQDTPHTPLAIWMAEHGYTSSTLAHELGFSYFMIRKLVLGNRGISHNFQLKFIKRFGREEADKVFDTSRLFAILETA